MREKIKKFWQIPGAALLFLVSFGGMAAARTIDGFADWYGTTIYPVLAGIVGRIFGLFSVSARNNGDLCAGGCHCNLGNPPHKKARTYYQKCGISCILSLFFICCKLWNSLLQNAVFCCDWPGGKRVFSRRLISAL